MRFYVYVVEYSKPIIWPKTKLPLGFKRYWSSQRFSISRFYVWLKLQLILNGGANKRVILALNCFEVKFCYGSINQKESLPRVILTIIIVIYWIFVNPTSTAKTAERQALAARLYAESSIYRG